MPLWFLWSLVFGLTLLVTLILGIAWAIGGWAGVIGVALAAIIATIMTGVEWWTSRPKPEEE